MQDASLVAKGAENGACGSPAKQFQNLPGMTEPCRTRVDCYTDSPPVRKLWGGILPRSDTSAFPRDASGGFTRCCYLSHCDGRGGECGFGVFVDNCRIMSVKGGSAALECLSISVALCRSRVGARLWCFCRYLSHYVGRGESSAFAFLSIFATLCRMREERGFSVFVGICRIMSVEGCEALAFCRYLSHFVDQWRERGSGAAVERGKGVVRGTNIVFNLLKKR